MLDSVTFFFEGPFVPAKGLPFSHQNLRINLKPNGVIVQGSLPKYFFGENASRMHRSAVEACLVKLSSELELDFLKAQVWSMEIGNTFQTKRPGWEYVSSFESMPLMERMTFGNGSTVLFTNKTRSFQAYDKALQMMDTMQTIVPQYRGETLLRLELKLKKDLSRILTRPVLGADLFNESFYKGLLDLFQDAYFSIVKRCSFQFPDLMELTPKGLESALVAQALESIGVSNILQMIEACRYNLDRLTIQRMKSLVLEKSHDSRHSYFDEMIQELDQQVIASCMYYR